jgi:hypothetical protein
MTDQLNDLMTAANPIRAEHADALPVGEAQRELFDGLLDLPVPRDPVRAPRHRRRVVPPRAVMAAGAVTAILVTILVLGTRGGGGGSGTAWAAEQVRFAEASPLVLLRTDGWRVEYANEESAKVGELHFRRGSARPQQTFNGDDTTPVPADTDSADLNWYAGDMAGWRRDRAASAVKTTTAPVLGTTARVYQYEGGTPGHRDITALFRYDGRVLEFRAGASGLDEFKALLASLERVDVDTWLWAMPESVVKAADRTSVVDEMLRGVTVPPGFDAADVAGADLTKDRYQLGAAVTGTVACQWFARWAEARRTGDDAGVREAVRAMQTAKDWPILHEMAREGAYPEVLLEFVKAMPSGRWFGRPLIGDVNSGLGCGVLHIKLGKQE